MKSKSLEDLLKIARIEGIGHNAGQKARELALHNWIKEWVVEIESTQPIIKHNLTSEDEDFVKYFMAYKIGDELMNDCIDIKSEPTRITTKVWALRRNSGDI